MLVAKQDIESLAIHQAKGAVINTARLIIYFARMNKRETDSVLEDNCFLPKKSILRGVNEKSDYVCELID